MAGLWISRSRPASDSYLSGLLATISILGQIIFEL